MAATWPNLERAECIPYSEKATDDNVVKTPTEGGYIFRRRRYTRAPKEFKFELRGLSASDVALLRDHFRDRQTALPFTWNNPADGRLYTVCFVEPPELVNVDGRFACKIYVREV